MRSDRGTEVHRYDERNNGVIGHWSSVIGHWSSVIGHWSSVIGHRSWSLRTSVPSYLRTSVPPYLRTSYFAPLSLHTSILIPALNEEESIGIVIDSVREYADVIIVVDNGSTDRTAEKAREHGAIVVHEPQRGYGAACLRGIIAIRDIVNTDPSLVTGHSSFILFLDADASDHPEDVRAIIDVMQTTNVGMCLGSRTTGLAESGSLTPQQQFGNWLSTWLIALIWKTNYTDLGPLRAVRWDVLEQLNMEDTTWGWSVEMQIKIAKYGISFQEIPVRYRKRIGTSKISGTVVGSVRAGAKILSTIARLALRR